MSEDRVKTTPTVLTPEQEAMERRRLVVPPVDVEVQNCRGQWVPAIPEPLFVGWRLRKSRCDCGETFPNRVAYRGHYALTHTLGLQP